MFKPEFERSGSGVLLFLHPLHKYDSNKIVFVFSRQPLDLLMPILRAKNLVTPTSKMVVHPKTGVQGWTPMYRTHPHPGQVLAHRQGLGVVSFALGQQFAVESHQAPLLSFDLGQPWYQHDGLEGLHCGLSPTWHEWSGNKIPPEPFFFSFPSLSSHLFSRSRLIPLCSITMVENCPENVSFWKYDLLIVTNVTI